MFHDEQGFLTHCKVASLMLGMLGQPEDPHINHHLRSAIREATKKTVTTAGNLKSAARQMSEAALRQVQDGSRTGLVVDHVVPVSVLVAKSKKLNDKSQSSIADLLREWSVLALITESEHQSLKNAGLLKSMPPNWDGHSKYARYIRAGIDLVPNQYMKATR